MMPRQPQHSRSSQRRRSGLAFMLALFVMAVTSVIVVTILDSLTLQRSALRNTIDFDRARYLAEAGVQHSLSMLESNFALNAATGFTVATTELPVGSGNTYQASVGPLAANGTRTITAQGTAGTTTRRIEIRVKMGG